LGSVLLIGCRTEIEEPKEIGKNLYPEFVGHELVYQVDSFIYQDYKQTYKPDSSSWQIRELIESKFIDSEGKSANRIVLYFRGNDSDRWEPFKVISSNLTDLGLEKVIDNQRVIKLAFPVAQNKSWDAGKYIGLYHEQSYAEVYTPIKVGLFQFDSAVTVVTDVYDSNIVELKSGKEIYVPTVGMIYKTEDQINYQGFQGYWKGYRLRMKLVSYK
jgi:hypothetical protein